MKFINDILDHLGLTRESIEDGKGRVKRGAQVAEVYAQRFDTRLAEIAETQKAALLKGTTRNIVVGIKATGLSEPLRPPQGTFWKIHHITAVFESTGTDPIPFLALNSDISPVIAIPGGPAQALDVGTMMASSMMADISITDKDYIVVNHVNGVNAQASTRVLLNVEEVSLEPTFDVVNS